MSHTSKIDWTDATWNPVTGCTKVSLGCAHCYAERQFPRIYGHQEVEDTTSSRRILRPRRFTDIMLHPDRLDAPRRWKAPRMVFVNSMSDLFHPDVPDSFIGQVFCTMAEAHWHTFQILTKRTVRMMRLLQHPPRSFPVAMLTGDVLPNVWIMTSAEDQRSADERLPLLLQTPAAVRGISMEPLLEAILLNSWPKRMYLRTVGCDGAAVRPGLDWVIIGGESGPQARPMHPNWARSILQECASTGVPCFMKQTGAWRPALWTAQTTNGRPWGTLDRTGQWFPQTTPWNGKQGDESDTGEYVMVYLPNKGNDPTTWPDAFRVRQFPTPRLITTQQRDGTLHLSAD